MKNDLIDIGGRHVRRFVPFPGPVQDDTLRCIRCGQLDEDGFHDDEVCRNIALGAVVVEEVTADDE